MFVDQIAYLLVLRENTNVEVIQNFQDTVFIDQK